MYNSVQFPAECLRRERIKGHVVQCLVKSLSMFSSHTISNEVSSKVLNETIGGGLCQA